MKYKVQHILLQIPGQRQGLGFESNEDSQHHDGSGVIIVCSLKYISQALIDLKS